MDAIIAAFANYGLPGLVIAALLLGLVRLFNRYDDVQEKRVSEKAETQLAIAKSAAADEKVAEAIGNLGAIIKAQRRE